MRHAQPTLLSNVTNKLLFTHEALAYARARGAISEERPRGDVNEQEMHTTLCTLGIALGTLFGKEATVLDD